MLPKELFLDYDEILKLSAFNTFIIRPLCFLSLLCYTLLCCQMQNVNAHFQTAWKIVKTFLPRWKLILFDFIRYLPLRFHWSHCLCVCLSLMLKFSIKSIWSISTFWIFFRNLSSHFIEFYFLSFLEVTIAFLHVLSTCAFFMCFFIVYNTPFRIRRMSHTVWDVQRNSIQPKSLY